MELAICINLFVLTIIVCIFIVKLNKTRKDVEDLATFTQNIFKEINTTKYYVKDIDDRLADTNKRITGLASPITTIGKELQAIKDIRDVVYKIQSVANVNRNLIEETRNSVKASKTRKTTKTDKTSSKEKSANSEAHTTSQTA